MAPPPSGNQPSNSSPSEDSLKTARALRAVMAGIADQIDRQNNSFRQQQTLVEAIKKAQESANMAGSAVAQLGSDEMQGAIESAIAESESLSRSMGKVGATAAKSGGAMSALAKVANSGLRKTVTILGETRNGFLAGMKVSTSFFGGIIRMGRTVVGTITDIAKVILGLPGTFLNFMQGAATGGIDEYRVALEELRKEFGDLSISTSRSVITMTESMRNFSATGVSFGRIFGYGRQGLATLLREFMKLAQEMGPLFSRFQEGTRGISREVIVLTKSSNITGEGLRAMQLAADNGGESVRVATLGMIRSLAQAQRTFGITVKEMGRDVNYMLKEYGTFGNVTRETMIRSSVYVRRLGMSIEALKKVMDKFLNFDDAAQSAAGMAEAFNMNIDAMRLMREQDPTKRLDMMREAFFRTGRNIDQMSVAERRHLSNLSGLSEEETRMAFSQRNRAMSGAQLDAQMRRSQRTQVTQAQALQTLARSIERLVQAGQPLHGSFFQIFIDGFRQGVMRSREFRGAVRAIQQSMHVVLRTGREVGRMFAAMFPGFKQFFEGVKEAFNPRRFRVLMGQVKTEFRNFFSDLADPQRRNSALGRFMTNMRQNFLNHFTTGSPAARRTMDGFRTFFTTIGRIAISGGKFFMEKLADGIREALAVVRRILIDPRGIGAALRELFTPASGQARLMGTGLVGTFREVLSFAGEQLGPAVMSIWDSVSGFINDKKVQDAFEQRIGPPLRKAGEIVGKYFLTAMFGPAVIGATLRGVGTLLTTVLGAFITKAAVKSAGTATAEAVGPVLRSLVTLAGAAKVVLAAVVALTVGFSLIPEKTVQFVRKAMEMFNGLGDKIGFLLGRLILGIGFLIKTAWNLVLMAVTNPATMLTYITKFGIAVLQAVGSLGALILSAFTGLFAGLAEGLGFKTKADEMRREFAKWKADFTESLGALPGAIRIVIDDIGNYLNSAFPRISRVFGIIGGYATRLRNALSIGRNEPPTLINNIETASRRAAASSNTATQQVVANAQRAQQASQTAQAAAQTAQRATQTAQNAAQGVANAAQPNAPDAEARMINPEDFRRSMTQVRTVVSELTTFAATAFRDFTPQQSETVRRGVQTVAQLLEAIKVIPEIANSVAGSGRGNAYTAISSLVGPQGIASFLFDTRAHREAQNLMDLVKTGGLIEKFVQAMPRNITQSTAKIASVFGAIKSITDVISSLGSSGGDANTGNVYSRFIEPLIGPNGILPLLFDFESSPSAVKFQEMFMRGGSIEQFANSLPDDYRNINRRLSSVSSVIGTVNQIVARVAENTERVATTFTTNSLVTATATFRANYVGQIDQLVTDFNRATGQLSQLNVGNVDITLDRIGDTLSRERTVRLETAAANVSVNVNVKINAADVQQALFEYSNSPRARNVGGVIRTTAFTPRTELSQ